MRQLYEPRPCAAETLDAETLTSQEAIRCGQCALLDTTTLVRITDGILEFDMGHCRMLTEFTSMISERPSARTTTEF